MNFRRCIVFSGGVVRTSIFPVSLLSALLSAYLVACADQVYLPSAKQATDFENALHARPTGAMEYVVKTKMSRGLSRVGGESNTTNEQRHPFKTSA